MLEATLERMLAELTAEDDGAELDRARSAFFERTGEFDPSDDCYEERIQLFFDHFLCAHQLPSGETPAERWLRRADADQAEAEVARGMARASRSLFAAASDDVVADLLGGGRFRVSGGRFRDGDVFDGHLLVVGEDLAFAPGIVFHPPQTHDAIQELLVAIGAPGDLDRQEILDGLLRMRLRLDRFTSIRPRHIYRAEALSDRSILSAGWAKREEV